MRAFFTSCIFFVALCNGFMQAQPYKNAATRAYLLQRMCAKYHVAFKPTNDAFAAVVFDQLLRKTDPYHVFFTAEEINELNKQALSIDDDILNQKTNFLDAFSARLKTAMARAVAINDSLLAKPFEFNSPQFFLKDSGFAPQKMLVARRMNFLKWLMLSEMDDLVDEDSATISAAWLKQNEGMVRDMVRSYGKKRWERLTQPEESFQKWVSDTYLEAISESFDPHTAYLSEMDKEELDDALSSESLSFGFETSEDDEGNLEVTDLTPGSEAFRSGDVFVGDKIIAIKLNNGQVVQIKTANPDEIMGILHANGDAIPVEFIIQSPDGSKKTVKLRRQIQRNDENIVRGWLLEKESRIGYITLPTFYTRQDENLGSNSAEDVAKEVIQLKKDKIEGLILDLRNNGGGSLQEAAEMLGIFIDLGPLGLIRNFDGTTDILKDRNRGTIYDGPMVILVNGASASASEIFASTLQDYGKALVAGSRTFGKSTMQIVLPLDTSINLLAEDDNTWSALIDEGQSQYGFAKITVGKLYRVAGNTIQVQGLKPDVYFPDVFEMAEYAEREFPTALPNDTIIKRIPLPTLFRSFSTEKLKGLSDAAIQEEPSFRYLANALEASRKQPLAKSIPLQLKAYNEWRVSMNSADPNFSLTNNQETPTAFRALNTSRDASYNQMDKYQQEMDETMRKEIEEDACIRQSFKLLMRIIKKEL